MTTYASDFYADLPVFGAFGAVLDPVSYRSLPDDWLVGLTDVEQSTQAIAQGRYKAVNTAGAAIISAMTNALSGRAFPFVFGGDGANFAVMAGDESFAREALATTAAWVRDELGLGLRAALVPVAAIRAAGFDVQVARFAASPHVAYAMFSGGGLAWAERELKASRFGVPAAQVGRRPDLSGLSCRWKDMPAVKGVVLSLVVAPVAHGSVEYRGVVEALLTEIESTDEALRPVPEGVRGVGWPPPGLELEARASRRSGESRWAARLRVAALTLFAHIVMRLNIKVGGFDPARYRREVVANSDFRKYDDTLRMTIDCTPALADRIEQRLTDAQRVGIVRFGTHRQRAAIMTCIVPSSSESNHFHFIDGAAGGYALAAGRLKAGRTAAPPDAASVSGKAH